MHIPVLKIGANIKTTIAGETRCKLVPREGQSHEDWTMSQEPLPAASLQVHQRALVSAGAWDSWGPVVERLEEVDGPRCPGLPEVTAALSGTLGRVSGATAWLFRRGTIEEVCATAEAIGWRIGGNLSRFAGVWFYLAEWQNRPIRAIAAPGPARNFYFRFIPGDIVGMDLSVFVRETDG